MSVSEDKKTKEAGLYETVKVIVQALILALIVRTFLFQPFNIPSGSMMDTLLIGDYLFVSKYSYGYSRYSFPYGLAPIEGRIWASEPERGDIAVFKLPRDNSTDYIKRVIGLPGDEIQMIDGVLHINDVAVGIEPAPDFIEIKGLDGEIQSLQGCRNEPVPQGGACAHEAWTETLPNGVSHTVLNMGRTPQDNTPVFTVEPGHIFFMGDNRDNSVDSRFSQVGQVPVDNLIGRAEVVALSSAGAFWEVWKWRFDRLFESID